MPTSNFRNRTEEVDDSEGKDEACNRKIHPLHTLQRFLIRASVLEEYIRPEDRRDYRPDTVERLRNVDTDFRVPWRSTDSYT